jgi:C4-dicarboxylate transporter DctM subunit
MGTPIILCLGIPPVIWLLATPSVPNLVIGQKMFAAGDSFALMAVPFFMLAGQIMERTGITEDIVKFANACIGWIRGGFAHTVELSGILLAGLSGSSNADTAALGAICLGPLKRAGYADGWASAIIVSAGSIGPIIPPSIVMIIYANAASLNIGKLFMGGVIPGIILGVGYMIVCYIYAKRHNITKTKFGGWKNIGKTFIKAIWALLMPLIIIGGILTGIFTATEAGVTATVYGFIYGLVRRRLNLKSIYDSIRDAAIAATGPVALISISSIFSYMLAREGVTGAIANFCQTGISSQVGFLAFVVAVCVFAGCFVDGTAVMLLLTPIFIPVTKAMGIDVQQFSIIFMIAIMSGGMTPPVGSQLFVVSAIDNTPISKLVKPIAPFILVVIFTMVIMMFIPGLTTWLPSLVGYN